MTKGRKTLPAEIKKLRGTAQPCREQATSGDIALARLTDVKPPAWLDTIAKKIFKSKAEQLMALNVLTILDIPSGDTILVPLPVHTSGVRELSVSGVVIPREKYSLLSDDYEPRLFVDREFGEQRIYVKAVVGYTDTTIPLAIKAAILLILGTLYDNESDNIVGRSVSELSLTAEKLLVPWRVTPYRDV